ncbi:MAG: catalase, partial [Eubacterium sp.]|nr:catalase [Eubacterium sp.]
MNIKGHLKTINHHKYLVTAMCFKVGLYKQGLLHDLSKYHPKEFLPGIKYYQGTCSPYNMEKKLHRMSRGWLHHKGRNLHHLEYWIDMSPVPGEGWVGMKMPKRYVAEMVIDRICASKNYQREAY